MLSLWEETVGSWFVYTAGSDRCVALVKVKVRREEEKRQ